MMRRIDCWSCKARLPVPGARCPYCGWASDYGSDVDRRVRKLRTGIALMAMGVFLALTVAVVVPYLRSFE